MMKLSNFAHYETLPCKYLLCKSKSEDKLPSLRIPVQSQQYRQYDNFYKPYSNVFSADFKQVFGNRVMKQVNGKTVGM